MESFQYSSVNFTHVKRFAFFYLAATYENHFKVIFCAFSRFFCCCWKATCVFCSTLRRPDTIAPCEEELSCLPVVGDVFWGPANFGRRLFSQKLEEQDRKALNTKEQLQREHRYLKRRLEQLSVSGSVERIRTDSMGSTISTDSEQGSLPMVQCSSRSAASEHEKKTTAIITDEKKKKKDLPVGLAC